MNGVQFRRGLALLGIKNGLDLGAAVAAAKDAEAWCLEAAGDGADVGALTGGPMLETRALPPPREKVERPPAKMKRATSTRASASPASQAQTKRHRDATAVRWATIDKALTAARGEGLSTVALQKAAGCSNPTIVTDLKVMLEAGHVIRRGPKVGPSVRWVMAKFASPPPSAHKTVAARKESKPAVSSARPPKRAGRVPGAEHEPAHREDVVARPSPATAPAGEAVAPPREPPRPAVSRASPPLAIVRNEKIEADVLEVIERAPQAGLDVTSICMKTSWPDNAVRNALTALRQDGRIISRGGFFLLRGVDA